MKITIVTSSSRHSDTQKGGKDAGASPVSHKKNGVTR